MITDTFFQICIYFCICMLIFGLSASFIAMSDFYTTSQELPVAVNITKTGNQTIADITSPNRDKELNIEDEKEDYTFNTIWDILYGAGAAAILGTILLAALFKDVKIIGVWIFGVVFWAAFWNLLTILSIGGTIVPAGIITIITGAVGVIFIAAVVGMLTGSG